MSAAAIDAPAPNFTVCPGTYALCTTAQCQLIPGGDPGKIKVSCLCDVKQGDSVGVKSCDSVPPVTPEKEGDSVPSRYFPIKATAVCLNNTPWAMCLDSPCKVDEDPSKAHCTCDLEASPAQGHLVVGDTFNGQTCTSNILWSSATVHDVLQVTAFLETSPKLKPFPITIVGVEAAK
jgi:hypothetical protein